ncbi:hypothetical protein ABZ770_16475 [Streptomyces sp. NPDC006654]|uniref:hypothetical protein n=1 Tax=Streptomyces sp. NPDC006654 TaxID=3156897 RepID=UPI0033E26C66
MTLANSSTVRQGDCGTAYSKFELVPVEGQFRSLLKNTYLNKCLDTNGIDVYFSDCWSPDSGQRWTAWMLGQNSSVRLSADVAPDKRLTGWNDGGISDAPPQTGADVGKGIWISV